MFAEERQQIILKTVIENKSITVKELAALLDVSMPTIRSDIDIICANFPDIERTHGGIVLSNKFIHQTPYEERKALNLKEKQSIANLAISLIKHKDTILIDSSSTSNEIANKLININVKITIITTGINIAIKLKENPNLTVIIIGGVLKPKSNTIQNSFDDSVINAFNIDKYFFSASGVSLKNGFSDYNYNEVVDKKRFLAKCQQSIALIDSSKFNIDSKSSFAQLKEVDYLITTQAVDKMVIDQYKKYVKVLTA